MLDTKSVVFRIAVGILLIALLHILCVEYLSDGAGSKDIGRQLERVGDKQQQTLEAVGRAGAGIDSAERNVTEAITAADELTDRLARLQVKSDSGKAILADSAERIRQCLAILQAAGTQRD